MTMRAQKFLLGLVATAIPLVPLLSFFVDWRIAGGSHSSLANALLLVGGAFCLVNFYCAFVRAPLLMRLGRKRGEIRNVSSVPLLGMFVVPGVLLAPPSNFLSAVSLLLVLIDAGNLSWFAIMTWKDDTLWSDRR